MSLKRLLMSIASGGLIAEGCSSLVGIGFGAGLLMAGVSLLLVAVNYE